MAQLVEYHQGNQNKKKCKNGTQRGDPPGGQDGERFGFMVWFFSANRANTRLTEDYEK